MIVFWQTKSSAYSFLRQQFYCDWDFVTRKNGICDDFVGFVFLWARKWKKKMSLYSSIGPERENHKQKSKRGVHKIILIGKDIRKIIISNYKFINSYHADGFEWKFSNYTIIRLKKGHGRVGMTKRITIRSKCNWIYLRERRGGIWYVNLQLT